MKNKITNIFLAASGLFAAFILVSECDDIVRFAWSHAAALVWLCVAVRISRKTAPGLWDDSEEI